MHDALLLTGAVAVISMVFALGHWEGKATGYCDGHKAGYNEGVTEYYRRRRINKGKVQS